MIPRELSKCTLCLFAIQSNSGYMFVSQSFIQYTTDPHLHHIIYFTLNQLNK